MKLTEQQASAFQALSYDKNPLHTQDEYSRKTSFGSRVFYGMGAVLYMLGMWAKGRRFRLQQIRGGFKRPLHLNEEYSIQFTEDKNQVSVQVSSANSVMYARIQFTWQEYTDKDQPHTTPGFTPLSSAKDFSGFSSEEKKIASYPYNIDISALHLLQQNFNISVEQLPWQQLNALLCTSYFIGMEMPGKQALFSDFSFDFDTGETAKNQSFEMTDVRIQTDDRFNRVNISGKGTGISRFQLGAFCRPGFVEYPLEEIRGAVGQSQQYEGKTVFISGASRGFGSVLAQAFALQGADLILNSRADSEDAAKVKGLVEGLGRKVSFIFGDVGSEKECKQIARHLSDSGARIDLLVNNAFPASPMTSLAEHNASGFLEHVRLSLATQVNSLFYFLPFLKKDALILMVSSIITQQPAPKFGPYLTAKAASEGLVQAFAAEYRNFKFIIARPPRMLTDSTNLIQNLDKPASAISVAAKLVKELASLSVEKNIFSIDL